MKFKVHDSDYIRVVALHFYYTKHSTKQQQQSFDSIKRSRSPFFRVKKTIKYKVNTNAMQPKH